MNILDKIMLASYYEDRLRDKTSDYAAFACKIWMSVVFMSWLLLISIAIGRIYNIDYSMIQSQEYDFIIVLILYIIAYLFSHYISKSKEDLEDLYNADALDYTQTWKYVYIPVIIPFVLMIFFLK
jgi:hypothetical protein